MAAVRIGYLDSKSPGCARSTVHKCGKTVDLLAKRLFANDSVFLPFATLGPYVQYNESNNDTELAILDKNSLLGALYLGRIDVSEALVPFGTPEEDFWQYSTPIINDRPCVYYKRQQVKESADIDLLLQLFKDNLLLLNVALFFISVVFLLFLNCCKITNKSNARLIPLTFQLLSAISTCVFCALLKMDFSGTIKTIKPYASYDDLGFKITNAQLHILMDPVGYAHVVQDNRTKSTVVREILKNVRLVPESDIIKTLTQDSTTVYISIGQGVRAFADPDFYESIYEDCVPNFNGFILWARPFAKESIWLENYNRHLWAEVGETIKEQRPLEMKHHLYDNYKPKPRPVALPLRALKWSSRALGCGLLSGFTVFLIERYVSLAQTCFRRTP